MSERWARTALMLYRCAGAAAYPLVGSYVAWRVAKGKEDKNRSRERYGFTQRQRPAGPLIWVHAASVGETMAVVPLIESILDYGVNIVLTTGTVTSAKVAEERLGQRIIHQYVPLDLKPAQLDVLMNLYRHPGMSQHDLARKLLVGRSNITMLLPQLESRGLLRREGDEKDRRVLRLTLTDTGVALLMEALKVHMELIELAMSQSTPEQCDMIGEQMRKITDALNGS